MEKLTFKDLQDKQNKIEEARLEFARDTIGLIENSPSAREIVRRLIGFLKEKSAITRVEMTAENQTKAVLDYQGTAVGRRPESIDERHARYDETAGYLRGLEEMEYTIQSLYKEVERGKQRDKEREEEKNNVIPIKKKRGV